MKRLRQLPNGPADDDGAALILALILVTVIGLGGAALLTFSDTSIRTTVALRDQAGKAYSADGAAQVAINSLRTGNGFTTPELFANADGTTCFGPNSTSGTLNLPDFYPATNGQNGNALSSASVVCTADPESGVNASLVPITSDNRPAQAILTLGRSSEDGTYVKSQGSSGVFSVNGAVRSNSNIEVDAGTLTSSAAVTAYGACNGAIASTPAKTCDTNANLPDPADAKPESYAAQATVVPDYQDVPDDVPASCPDGVVTFLPGYYDNAAKLTDLMTGNGDCGGSTWWFKPGTYYFDFHNNTDDRDVYLGHDTDAGNTADQWGIKRGRLVAGTPVDANGNVLASPGPSPTIPGSCQSPLRSTSAQGVQFIFGGDSQLALEGSADAEICGTYSATRPPIGVFGLKTGEATIATLTGPGTTPTSSLKMDTVVSPGLFTNPTRVKEQAETNGSSTWVKATTTPPSETSTITVSGYEPPSPIPAGSIVKSASIRVRHGNSSTYTKYGPTKDILALTFTPNGRESIPFKIALNPAGRGLNVSSFDIYEGGTSDFVKDVHDHGFTGATMAWTATLFHAGIESLDAIQIDIEYVIPAFRSQSIATIDSNCMNLPHPSGGSCAVLSTSALSNFSGNLAIQGTIYTPLAAIDLTMNNDSQQVVSFGVISRSFLVKQTGSFSYAGSVVAIPDDSDGDGSLTPIVHLTVYICPATTTSSCSTDAGAVEALRVKARMTGLTRPSPMTILSWSNLR